MEEFIPAFVIYRGNHKIFPVVEPDCFPHSRFCGLPKKATAILRETALYPKGFSLRFLHFPPTGDN